MQYMLLIYDNEAEMLGRRTGSTDVMMKDYREFTDSIVKSGNMKAGDALQPTSTATCVRIRNGKTLTTDGPFAETKEQLGGYYVIEAKDLDEATKIAARVPSAKSGTIEVKPDQKGVVTAVLANARGGGQIFIVKLDDGQELTVPRQALMKASLARRRA